MPISEIVLYSFQVIYSEKINYSQDNVTLCTFARIFRTPADYFLSLSVLYLHTFVLIHLRGTRDK